MFVSDIMVVLELMGQYLAILVLGTHFNNQYRKANNEQRYSEVVQCR